MNVGELTIAVHIAEDAETRLVMAALAVLRAADQEEAVALPPALDATLRHLARVLQQTGATPEILTRSTYEP